jgi:hypothetical protein
MLVLFALGQHRTVSATSTAPALQKAVPEAETILRRLAQDHPGMLEPIRAGWSPHNASSSYAAQISSSPSMTCMTALMSARWVNACG